MVFVEKTSAIVTAVLILEDLSDSNSGLDLGASRGSNNGLLCTLQY